MTRQVPAGTPTRAVIEKLDLRPHPEGGWYREIYRSSDRVHTSRGARSAITTIYYLLERNQVGRWHVVAADEIWHFYEGSPLELLAYDPRARAMVHSVLSHTKEDHQPVAVIRKGLGRRFEVATFQDPFEALVALGTTEPDVLVIDIDVGGLDGIRCLTRLCSIEATSHVRTIVYSNEERRRSALEAGASDFIARGDVTLLREALERATGLERT